MRRFLAALAVLVAGGIGTTMIPAPSSVAAAQAPPRAERTIEIPSIDRAGDDFTVPQVSIVAPDKPVSRGQLVVFNASPLRDAPKELIKYTYVWIVSPDPGGMLLPDNGSQGGFGTGKQGDPSQYKLTLVANFAFVDANNKLTLKSSKTETTVYVTDGDSPAPGPTPGPSPVPPTPVPVPPGPVPPGPTPSPQIPDGRFKLGQFIYGLSKSKPTAERTALASALRQVAGQISKGAATPDGIKSKAQLIQATNIAFRDALKSSYDSWEPILTAMGKQMDSLGIAILADNQDAYIELATGLEAL